MKTVVIVGALDTKGREFAFVKDLIEKQGLRTLIVDFGILGEPTIEPDIRREEVAKAAGGNLEHLRRNRLRDEAMPTMADGLAVVVRRLYDQAKLDGILGMGGGGGTFIATAGMRVLPFGVPKVMVSTIAGGDVRPFVGPKDIVMIPSVVDVAGINRMSARVYANAAGAIAGMLKVEAPATGQEKPLITASMFGNTTPCVDRARCILTDNGYEVLVFHATGIGGRTMESMIADGHIAGCLDVTTTELADEVCGGGASAGPERGMAASRAGIPAVIVPGCVDMANFGALDAVPERYRDRTLYEWIPTATLLRTSVEENRRIGEMIAAAANASTAAVAIVIPLKGVSMLDIEGGVFWDPEADNACYDAIKDNLKPGIPVIDVNNNINDPPFADKAAEILLDMLRQLNW
jgi:uncharacterized protein (UPF0261 family)